ATRPAGQSATDARWSWADDFRKGHRRVWEVKTGTPDAVPRSYVNQVLGQITEERQRHPKAIVYGCLPVEGGQAASDAQRAAGADPVAACPVNDKAASTRRAYHRHGRGDLR